MNTLFKFYIQVWVILGIVSALIVADFGGRPARLINCSLALYGRDWWSCSWLHRWSIRCWVLLPV